MSANLYNSYRLPVPEEFSNIFSHFYVAENNTSQPVTKSLMPTFQTILAFSFGSVTTLVSDNTTEIKVDKVLVIGPVKKAFAYTIPPGGSLLVVSFKNDAFFRFFGPVTLRDHVPANPDGLLNENCFTHLWQQLAIIDDIEHKVAMILEFSRPYIKDPSLTATLLANFDNPGLSPIKAVAEMTNKTERAIQQQHKRQFGFTSKEKLRYLRFLKTLQYLQQTRETVNWQDVVHDYGFYDQSQLIHDFRHFINLTPKQYIAFQQDVYMGK